MFTNTTHTQGGGERRDKVGRETQGETNTRRREGKNWLLWNTFLKFVKGKRKFCEGGLILNDFDPVSIDVLVKNTHKYQTSIKI